MSVTGPIVGVGAIVLKDGALLLVRRDREPALGRWSLPGGRVEPGELLVDAVRREVKEETGLDVEVGDRAGVFEVIGDAHYVVIDYFATCQAEQAVSAGTDAADVRWVPVDRLGELDCTPRLRETLAEWGVIPFYEQK